MKYQDTCATMQAQKDKAAEADLADKAPINLPQVETVKRLERRSQPRPVDLVRMLYWLLTYFTSC